MSKKNQKNDKDQPNIPSLSWWFEKIAIFVGAIAALTAIYTFFFRNTTPSTTNFKTIVNMPAKPEKSGEVTNRVDPAAPRVRKKNKNQSENSQKPSESLLSYQDFVNEGEGKNDVAVVIVNTDGEFENPIASKIAELYQAKGYSVTRSLFKLNFIKSKYLVQLENADADIIDKLNLVRMVKLVIIGRYSNSFESGEYTKYIARAQLKISIISCISKSQRDAFKISAANGFDDKDHAELGAAEKILSDYQMNHTSVVL